MIAAGRALLAALLLAPLAAPCQRADFPSRPIRIVVPYAPGGASDIVARLLQAQLSQAWRQAVVVENRPGANSILGTQNVVGSPPDGHTLLVATSALIFNQLLQAKLPYDPLHDLAPVSGLVVAPLLVAVNASVPDKTVGDLRNRSRARPGAIYFGSPGPGTLSHLAGELFNAMAGTALVHIPYKGAGPALADLMANHVGVVFAETASVLPFIRQGRLRALAVTGKKRMAALPDVPTLAESGLPGYEATQWYAMMAPRRTPGPIVSRIHADLRRALDSREFQARQQDSGWQSAPMTPPELQSFLNEEHRKWAQLVRARSIKVE